MTDSRYYVVRYTLTHASSNPRYRYMNSTVLNCMLDDLKPNTQFEFAVKVVKVKPATSFDIDLHLCASPSLNDPSSLLCRIVKKVRGVWW